MQIAVSGFGSVLNLSDGCTVPINIRPQRLDRALQEFERPSLGELLTSRSLAVFADVWQTPNLDWERVSEIIQSSLVAVAKFQDFPGIWKVFGLPAAVVRELPHRVYGGLDQALYTSHPFQFLEDPNRPAPWCRALLHAVGGWVFETWVHLDSGHAEVVGEVLPGHFVE
jgi:hypothetical protein